MSKLHEDTTATLEIVTDIKALAVATDAKIDALAAQLTALTQAHGTTTSAVTDNTAQISAIADAVGASVSVQPIKG